MWRDCSYVIRGKTRKLVFVALEGPKTPTQLSKSLKTALPHISRALVELEAKGLVECLTPSEKVGRIYKLTKKGKVALKKVKEMQGH